MRLVAAFTSITVQSKEQEVFFASSSSACQTGLSTLPLSSWLFSRTRNSIQIPRLLSIIQL